MARRVRRATPASSSARPRSRRRAAAPRSAAARRSSTGRGQSGEALAQAGVVGGRSAAPCTAATLPSPPHCTLSRPPGRSAAASAREQRVVVGHPVEGRVGEHRVDLLAVVQAQRGEVGPPHVDRLPRELLARAGDHVGRGVDGDDPPARQPLEQHAGDPARAAAGVEHRLVAGSARAGRARRRPISTCGPETPVVGLRVPVAHLPGHASAVVTGPPRSRSRS